MNSKISKTAIALSLMVPAFAASAQTWENDAKDAWIDGKAETVLLLNGNLNNFDINTDVEHGKVILTGQVDSDVDKSLAEELVEGIDGVKDVDNELTVVESSDATDNAKDEQTMTDAKITAVVKTRLLFSSDVSGTDINVDTDKGVVTLKGKLDSDAEKDLAINIAKNTDDVDDVVDKITVTKS